MLLPYLCLINVKGDLTRKDKTENKIYQIVYSKTI